MKLSFQIEEKELRELIAAHILRQIGATIDPASIAVEVKSKQNYRSEWEAAAFRATFSSDLKES